MDPNDGSTAVTLVWSGLRAVGIFYGEQIPSMPDVLERLKVLIDSSTPIVVMETVEEMRVVRLVRAACSALNLATFEWSIASGLARCGVNHLIPDLESPIPAGGYQGSAPRHAPEQDTQALYNSREPDQMLSNLQGISIEAVFILKDLHRHLDSPVVVRRLRDVGQQFSTNRRTVVLTGPKIEIPLNFAAWWSLWSYLYPTALAFARLLTKPWCAWKNPHLAAQTQWRGNVRHCREPSWTDGRRSRARYLTSTGGALCPLSGNRNRRSRREKGSAAPVRDARVC